MKTIQFVYFVKGFIFLFPLKICWITQMHSNRDWPIIFKPVIEIGQVSVLSFHMTLCRHVLGLVALVGEFLFNHYNCFIFRSQLIFATYLKNICSLQVWSYWSNISTHFTTCYLISVSVVDLIRIDSVTIKKLFMNRERPWLNVNTSR